MNHKKLLHYTLFLIILIGNSLGVSPEFLNNNQKLDKAKTLSNLDLITQPSKIFSYEYNIRLGKNNYYLRNYNQANRYLNMSLKLAKDSLQKANTYYWLGRNSLINNEPEKATHYFAQVLKHNKNIEPEFLFFYGMALYTIEQYDDALNVFLNFESQVKDESQKEELPLFIGASALGKGDFGLAQQYLNQIISQNNKKFFPIPEYLL
jgi:tetratricopeptide (TPR) repeat protein